MSWLVLLLVIIGGEMASCKCSKTDARLMQFIVAHLCFFGSCSTVMNVNNEFKLFAPKVREALGMANDINQAPKVGSTMGPRGTLAAACAGAPKI